MSSSAPKRRLDVRQETPKRTARQAGRPAAPSPQALPSSHPSHGRRIRADHGWFWFRGRWWPRRQRRAVGQQLPDDLRDLHRRLTRHQRRRRQPRLRPQPRQAGQGPGRADAASRWPSSPRARRRSTKKKNQWVLPVTGYHLTARFGQRSGLWSTVHTGPRLRRPVRLDDHLGRRRHRQVDRLRRRLRQPHGHHARSTAPTSGTATRAASRSASARRSVPARSSATPARPAT